MKYYIIQNTYSGFRKYNKQQIKSAKLFLHIAQFEANIHHNDVESISFYTKLLEYDKEYLTLLNDFELMIIESIRDRYAPKLTRNSAYIKSYKSIFEKWVEFFEKKKNLVFGHFNPLIIGKNLKALRLKEEITKSQLASYLDVDRKTVYLIETGERLPSLEYIYKFSKAFNCSIEELIEQSIKEDSKE